MKHIYARVRNAFLAAFLALAILASPANAGATPGITRYNQYVAQLTNVGCGMWWTPRWGDSFWVCPVGQLWRVTLHEATDTATLRRWR